jgi:hypothetical protein
LIPVADAAAHSGPQPPGRVTVIIYTAAAKPLLDEADASLHEGVIDISAFIEAAKRPMHGA